MRALVISDTHFGAWTGDDLLRHQFALDALSPALADVDELIILGDLYDFLFSTVENAFASAEAFFSLVEERMAGKRLVFLAGNHDHHIAVRQLATYVEFEVATADEEELEAALAGHRGYFKRYLDRRLPDIDSEIVYPTYRFGDALCFHGHYLDAHMTGSLADRLLNRGTWGIAGGRQPKPTISDYEATIVPLTELLYTVAQLPNGTAAQQSALEHLQRLAHLAGFVRAPARELSRLRKTLRGRGRSRAEPNPTRTVDPTDHPSGALSAYGKVVRNLGWDHETKTMVFAHTHQPLARAADDAGDGLVFWNTGSWIYEPPGGDEAWERYRERAWPGSAVVLDTERPEPELLRLLESYAIQGPGWEPST